MSAPAATRDEDSAGRFATTRWSVVLACAGSSSTSQAQSALTYLCRIYWRPVFAFICRQGTDEVDAQDLTQEFFMKVMEGELLRVANQERGRFRCLLLKALQNFLHDTNAKKTAKKRGGELNFISWDDWMAESPSQLMLPEQAVESWSGERLFDVGWAATLAEQALRRLREECEARGRRRVFDSVAGFLAVDQGHASYVETARQLGIGLVALKSLVHRLRERYRHLLREEVAQTVNDPTQVDDELRYLCSTLIAASA